MKIVNTLHRNQKFSINTTIVKIYGKHFKYLKNVQGYKVVCGRVKLEVIESDVRASLNLNARTSIAQSLKGKRVGVV